MNDQAPAKPASIAGLIVFAGIILAGLLLSLSRGPLFRSVLILGGSLLAASLLVLLRVILLRIIPGRLDLPRKQIKRGFVVSGAIGLLGFVLCALIWFYNPRLAFCVLCAAEGYWVIVACYLYVRGA